VTQPDGKSSGLCPDAILGHAEQLARLPGDVLVPRSVHARRSVSAAYYAVFHRVSLNLAWAAVPLGPDSARWELCRATGHSSIATVAGWVNGRGTPPTPVAGLAELARESAELRTFALGFVQLKGLREDADYDHRATFGRDVAIAACRTARRATDALEAVYGEPRWATFATLAILRGTR